MTNPVLENMLTRRSIRRFIPQQISDEARDAILLAGRYAPTGMDLQSWRFTVIQDPAWMERVNTAIREAFLLYQVTDQTTPYMRGLVEKAKAGKAGFLFRAPTCVIVTNGVHIENATADCALAIGNMMLAAHALGVGSCWVSQLSRLTRLTPVRHLLDELGLPDDHIVCGSVVLGYPQGAPPQAPPRKEDPVRIF